MQIEMNKKDIEVMQIFFEDLEKFKITKPHKLKGWSINGLSYIIYKNMNLWNRHKILKMRNQCYLNPGIESGHLKMRETDWAKLTITEEVLDYIVCNIKPRNPMLETIEKHNLFMAISCAINVKNMNKEEIAEIEKSVSAKLDELSGLPFIFMTANEYQEFINTFYSKLLYPGRIFTTTDYLKKIHNNNY